MPSCKRLIEEGSTGVPPPAIFAKAKTLLYSLAFGLSGKEFVIPYLTNTYNRNSQTIYNCLGIGHQKNLGLRRVTFVHPRPYGCFNLPHLGNGQYPLTMVLCIPNKAPNYGLGLTLSIVKSILHGLIHCRPRCAPDVFLWAKIPGVYKQNCV